MKAIELEGLPERVAHAVEIIVDALRSQFAAAPQKRDPFDLPRWPGQVLSDVTREEIYGEVG